jgi:hypothetical protein
VLCRYARFGFGAAAAAGMLGGPVMLFNPGWASDSSENAACVDEQNVCEADLRSREC